MEQKIKNLVFQQFGTTKTKKCKDWRGYQVYKPILDSGFYVGYPFVVLVKQNNIRWSTIKETLDWLASKQSQ